ncbi:DUF445 domain-containing protein [Spirillospora sp. CA-294931]|uniref:DUF445 domain-containing protein n=1 Tax=Spirillospora sp. CA-294931 TaxID=3240042 RepID=UPI003D905BEC
MHLDDWWILLSMPVIAAVIGYLTKVAAIEMMFRPLEFVGIRPVLGWQGVVPRYADRMARTAVRILTGRLLTAAELLERIELDDLLDRIEEPLRQTVDEVVREIALEYQPGLWESAPVAVRRMVVERVQAETPGMVREIFADLRRDAAEILDLEEMAVAAITRDKALLNRLIRDVARDELAFIVRSGIYFGLIIGMVQALGWALTGSHLVMPLFGAFTGLFSDWIALRMVFRPVRRRRVFGVLPWQGLFHRRRAEVTASYATVIAEEVLNPANLMEALLTGPSGAKLAVLVRRALERAIDERAGVAKPLLVAWVGGRRMQDLKRDMAALVIEKASRPLGHAETYVAESLDLRTYIEAKMKLMTAEEYEDLLRPAFKQDEWKLVAVGALLGFLVGEAQLLLVLHFT